MKKSVFLLGSVLLASALFAKTSTPKGWTDDYDAALKRAADEGKYVLADFSGSDWCGWCKRLDREVFDTEAFRQGAEKKFVLLMVDSPRDPSLLSEKAAKRNPELVKKYRVAGFPTVLVLDAKGAVVAKTGYAPGGPENYLAALEKLLADAPDQLRYIKPIEDVLNRYDAQMEAEIEAAMKKLTEANPKPAEDAGSDAQAKWSKKMQRKSADVLFGEVAAKYIPLYEKAFAEAKAMKVPSGMEAAKKALIDEQETRFNSLKMMKAQYDARKKADGAKKPKK